MDRSDVEDGLWGDTESPAIWGADIMSFASNLYAETACFPVFTISVRPLLCSNIPWYSIVREFGHATTAGFLKRLISFCVSCAFSWLKFIQPQKGTKQDVKGVRNRFPHKFNKRFLTPCSSISVRPLLCSNIPWYSIVREFGHATTAGFLKRLISFCVSCAFSWLKFIQPQKGTKDTKKEQVKGRPKVDVKGVRNRFPHKFNKRFLTPFLPPSQRLLDS